MIETSVKDTVAQSLFDAYGPAFGLVTLNEPLRPDAPAQDMRLMQRMHGIFVGELQALGLAARAAAPGFSDPLEPSSQPPSSPGDS